MLYKFRRSSALEYTLDIIRQNRLYCADFRDLNDPMEGTYDTLVSADHAPHSEQVNEIFASKVGTRICSLTRTYKQHPMWAYYAEDYRGLAIELDLPDDAAHPIYYASGSHIQSWGNGDDAYQIAKRILTTKHSAWSHEKEVRLLNEGEYYRLPPNAITRIIFGSRCDDEFRGTVSKECALFNIPTAILGVRNGRLHAK
tara:strand:- start:1932 stop:2528 length:597 start_codon:yes stop_codon:yes gene_type:complete